MNSSTCTFLLLALVATASTGVSAGGLRGSATRSISKARSLAALQTPLVDCDDLCACQLDCPSCNYVSVWPFGKSRDALDAICWAEYDACTFFNLGKPLCDLTCKPTCQAGNDVIRSANERRACLADPLTCACDVAEAAAETALAAVGVVVPKDLSVLAEALVPDLLETLANTKVKALSDLITNSETAVKAIVDVAENVYDELTHCELAQTLAVPVFPKCGVVETVKLPVCAPRPEAVHEAAHRVEEAFAPLIDEVHGMLYPGQAASASSRRLGNNLLPCNDDAAVQIGISLNAGAFEAVQLGLGASVDVLFGCNAVFDKDTNSFGPGHMYTQLLSSVGVSLSADIVEILFPTPTSDSLGDANVQVKLAYYPPSSASSVIFNAGGGANAVGFGFDGDVSVGVSLMQGVLGVSMSPPLILGADITECLNGACPALPLSKLLQGGEKLSVPSKVNAVYVAFQVDIANAVSVLGQLAAAKDTAGVTGASALADAFKPELAISRSFGKAKELSCSGAKAQTDGGAGC